MCSKVYSILYYSIVNYINTFPSISVPVKTISKDELLACLPTLYNNLEDRAADVRKAANDAVLGFMIHLGFNSMTSAREKILKVSLFFH